MNDCDEHTREAVGNPCAAVAIGEASPSDVVAALMGSDHVTLTGFATAPTMPSWLAPGLALLDARHAGPAEVAAARHARRQRMRTLFIGAVIASHVALASAVALGMRQLDEPRPASRAAWRALQVNEAGVTVRLGTTPDAPVVEIPTGGRLPSGERLHATIPSKRAYITDSATILLRNEP